MAEEEKKMTKTNIEIAVINFIESCSKASSRCMTVFFIFLRNSINKINRMSFEKPNRADNLYFKFCVKIVNNRI